MMRQERKKTQVSKEMVGAQSPTLKALKQRDMDEIGRQEQVQGCDCCRSRWPNLQLSRIVAYIVP